MEIANVHALEWGDEQEHGGSRFRAARLGDRIGAELLGATAYEVAPRRKHWPYHLHHANEEWLLVLRGRPTLRTPGGERQLAEGDVACFPRGPAGAHQVRNDTDEPVRILLLSSKLAPEIVEYPDTGKVGTRDAEGERIALTRQGEPVGYWDGES